MTDSDPDALLAVQSRSYRVAGDGLRRSWPEDDALDRDGLRALIHDVHHGVLATSRTAVPTRRRSPSRSPRERSGSAASRGGAW
ncbi:MAG: hypothetical protein ABWY96_09900 [Gaiellaceae bacterium]|jgi:hypothetical protein